MTLIAGLTLSLDGYFEDANGSAAALYTDLDDLRDSAYMKAMQAETGAVLMGRRTFDMGGDPDFYADGYEFQVPLFVLTHRAPDRVPKRNDRLYFTFVTDGLESAVAQATAAAGDRAVTVVGGAELNRQLLAAGLVDELRVDVMPVLLGGGRRLFDDVAGMRLEKLGVEEAGGRTSLSFRVVGPLS
ncbi:dihydrofolate reductase family protein [Geodermatophilus sabuli]|uniref:Dihydrofolate reductase n=1 Tax=Geodermatophilus sabuli TaxID=1564158 RepID=A0A285ED18_9ACTN|nr:dihydrofolate reductase family protein [Geodermatophilus sabuli]MBB3083268.1 dihydrofolate reductase [Geodermatophilus sabuli]SNX97009.1 Dihydrofolate reductase [Geodermatophilus sabuli]